MRSDSISSLPCCVTAPRGGYRLAWPGLACPAWLGWAAMLAGLLLHCVLYLRHSAKRPARLSTTGAWLGRLQAVYCRLATTPRSLYSLAGLYFIMGLTDNSVKYANLTFHTAVTILVLIRQNLHQIKKIPV